MYSISDPGPEEHGGETVFFGPVRELAGAVGSLTADYLFHRKRVAIPPVARAGGEAGAAAAGALLLKGAAEHNLKDIDVQIPLRRLVCVTGVSGSGKSTLVHDILYPALQRAKGKPTENPGRHSALEGADLIDDVVMVDQNRIGRTTRSNPASYVGAFDAIRDLFARLPQARERKYTAGTFSFNAGNGAAPPAAGMASNTWKCNSCRTCICVVRIANGRRYRAEILEVKLTRGDMPSKSIADVLDLTVTEALVFFASDPEVCLRLSPLAEVGLDYLRLGQPRAHAVGRRGTASQARGGIWPRIRYVCTRPPRRPPIERGPANPCPAAPVRRPAADRCFLFDEPTTGLHFDDVAKLLRAFRRLIDAGHSLLVIEHNLDVVRASDWIIDLGPEGGEAGGSVVCVGTPAAVMRHAASHTGRALADAGNLLPPAVLWRTRTQ